MRLRHRTRKCWCVRLVVAVGFAATVQAPLAWMLAWCVPLHERSLLPSGLHAESQRDVEALSGWVSREVPRTWPDRLEFLEETSGLGIESFYFSTSRLERGWYVTYRGYGTRAGWPFASMQHMEAHTYVGRIVGAKPDVGALAPAESHLVIHARVDSDMAWEWLSDHSIPFADAFPVPNDIGIPLSPIPLGFGLNIAVFTTVTIFLWCVPGAVIRWRRKRRGFCVCCGYDRAGISVNTPCPECETVPKG